MERNRTILQFKSRLASRFLKLENDIPSHDTFNRVISSIDNEQLEKCFMEWVNTLIDSSIGLEIINIDGKTINGAKEHGKKSLIHMVSAWACKNNLIFRPSQGR